MADAPVDQMLDALPGRVAAAVAGALSTLPTPAVNRASAAADEAVRVSLAEFRAALPKPLAPAPVAR